MQKLQVRPVGTCRVTNIFKTPYVMRRIELNRSGVYGFVQTPGEIVQLAHYLNGGFAIPEAMIPLVAPNLKYVTPIDPTGEAPDFHIVEISSLRGLEYEGCYLQPNYFRAYFQNFLSDANGSRKYWRSVRNDTKEQRFELLCKMEGFEELSDIDRDILLNVDRFHESDDDLKKNISQLNNLLPNAIFVAHCEAVDPDGQLLASRQSAIEAVKSAVWSLNLPYFDVSSISNSVGQQNTFLQGDDSLTHYSSEFELRLYHELDTMFFSDRRQSLGLSCNVDDELAELEEEIARLKRVAVNAAQEEFENELTACFEKFGEVPEFFEIQFTFALRNKDSEGVRHSMSKLSENSISFSNNWVDIINVYSACSQWSYIEEIDKDLTESSEHNVSTLTAISNAYFEAGQYSSASQKLQDLYLEHRFKGSVLERIIKLSLLAGEIEVAQRWARELERQAPGSKESLFANVSIFAALGDNSSLETEIAELLVVTPEALKDIIELAREQDIANAVARNLEALDTTDPNLSTNIRSLVQRWRDQIEQVQNDADKLRLLDAITRVEPDNFSTLAQLRTLTTAKRLAVRSAFKSREYDRVIEIGNELKVVAKSVKDVLPVIGRAHFQNDDFQNSDFWLNLAELFAPDDTKIWSLRLKVSLKNENYQDALRLIEALEGLSPEGDTNQKLISEASRQKSRIASLAISKARRVLSQSDPSAEELLISWSDVELALVLEPSNDRAEPTKASILRHALRHLGDIIDAPPGQRLMTSDAVLKMKPDSSTAFKVRAVALMEMRNFNEALKSWKELRSLSENVDSIDFQIQKCLKFIAA